MEEKNLSDILLREDAQGSVQEYKLPDFADPTPVAPYTPPPFVPEHMGSQRQEFVPGGFDFDFKGGLRNHEILNRAAIEAERIVKEATQNANSITQSSKEAGFEEGHNTGRTAAQNELAPAVAAFTKALEEITSIRTKFYEQSEKEMIDLVIAVARTVIGIELEAKPELVQPVIKRAISHLQSREKMNVRVNPEDLAEAEKTRENLAREVEDINNVTFQTDGFITRGGCVVETNIGSIDARLETQLESVRETFRRASE